MELFSRRRWTTGSAEQSNVYGIMTCMCCINSFGFNINTTAFCLGLSSLHLLILKSSMTDQFKMLHSWITFLSRLLQDLDGVRNDERWRVLSEDDGQLHHLPGQADHPVPWLSEGAISWSLPCLSACLSPWRSGYPRSYLNCISTIRPFLLNQVLRQLKQRTLLCRGTP